MRVTLITENKVLSVFKVAQSRRKTHGELTRQGAAKTSLMNIDNILSVQEEAEIEDEPAHARLFLAKPEAGSPVEFIDVCETLEEVKRMLRDASVLKESIATFESPEFPSVAFW